MNYQAHSCTADIHVRRRRLGRNSPVCICHTFRRWRSACMDNNSPYFCHNPCCLWFPVRNNHILQHRNKKMYVCYKKINYLIRSFLNELCSIGQKIPANFLYIHSYSYFIPMKWYITRKLNSVLNSKCIDYLRNILFILQNLPFLNRSNCKSNDFSKNN